MQRRPRKARRRYRREFAVRVGQILLEEGREIKLEPVARTLDVRVRTLSNWKRLAREAAPERKLGRPRHTKEAHHRAMWLVGRELKKQGYPGWRVISHALAGAAPDRLIQLYVSQFKERRKKRKAARIARNRVTVRVLARDTIWGQDGTHVGRSKKRRAIESQVIRDRGSLAFAGLQTGPMADHQDVLKLLKETARRRAGHPLVYSRDNGSMYEHEDVQRYMEKHQIIVLRSLPRTPQHNGATERSIQELKVATGLGKGELWDQQDSHSALVAAAARLNENRIRPSKGFKTANELDDTLPVGYNCGRDRFYRECRQNMAKAVQEAQTKRAARFAEREAIFSTLEKFGLIKRSRGGKPYVQKQEIFS